MKTKILWISLLFLLALAIAACGAPSATPDAPMHNDLAPTQVASAGSPGMTDKDGETTMPDDPIDASSETVAAKDEPTAIVDDPVASDPPTTAQPGVSASSSTASSSENVTAPDTSQVAMVDLPGWFSAGLVDVRSGEAFTLADLKGKVVLVETMAIWCSNCLKQQKEVKALHEAMGEIPDLVTIVLDIDANEDAGNLQAYADKNGFDWTYAVAPRAVAREIGQLYGDQFLNPPSTPMLIVDRHGEVHPLPFGIKSAASLQEALQPFLSDSL